MMTRPMRRSQADELATQLRTSKRAEKIVRIMAVTVVYDQKVEPSLRNLPRERVRVTTQCDKSSVTLY